MGLVYGIVMPGDYYICCYCLLLVLWDCAVVVRFAYIAFSLSLKMLNIRCSMGGGGGRIY